MRRAPLCGRRERALAAGGTREDARGDQLGDDLDDLGAEAAQVPAVALREAQEVPRATRQGRRLCMCSCSLSVLSPSRRWSFVLAP